MIDLSCSSCGKAQAPIQCGLCHCQLCKGCAQFIEADSFSLLPEIPADLAHAAYCAPCFNQKVQPEIEAYEETLARAKETIVYFKSQSKETRLIRRIQKPVKVDACEDYDETILRLAFLAARANQNAIIDVQINSKKIHIHSYQTTQYSGSAIPARIVVNSADEARPELKNPN